MIRSKRIALFSLIAAALLAVAVPVISYGLSSPQEEVVESEAHAHDEHKHTHEHEHEYEDDSTEATPLSYRLRWEWGAAEALTTGGWRVTNELGFIVEVHSGYLTTANVELIPCTRETAGLSHSLTELVTTRVVHAGHGEGERDLSALGQAQIESLGDPQATVATSELGAEAGYCQLHYLLAYATPDVADQEERNEMVGQTILLQGTYWPSERGDPAPFEIRSEVAWGTLLTLAAGDAILPAGDGAATLTLTRRLDTLFSGVDFEAMDDDEIARSVLRSIVQSMTVAID